MTKMGPKDETHSAAYAVGQGTYAEPGPNDSREELVKPIKSWKGYLWDTWELPADQGRLLFKVDAFVLTFASVSTSLYFGFISRERCCVLFY